MVRFNRMKRVEFTIRNDDGDLLREPGFVDQCSELPAAIMLAVEDFMEVNGGKLHLPLLIHVKPVADAEVC
jgi:hypothetical protein